MTKVERLSEMEAGLDCSRAVSQPRCIHIKHNSTAESGS
jgi:hypothetical protein